METSAPTVELTPVPPPEAESLFASVLGLVLLIGLAFHLLLVLCSFVLHYYDTSTRGRRHQPMAVYLRAFVTDWWYSLAYTFSFALGWLPHLRSPPVSEAGGPPILLVHGYMVNRACMFATYWRLRRLGFKYVYTVNLRPPFGPIEEIAKNLTARLCELSARHRGEHLYVVAHSLGAIATRQCLHEEPELPVAKLISIGAPHRGTTTAYFGVARAAIQLRPGSAFLAELPEAAPVPTTSIYSLVDNLVIPPDSAALGDHVVELTGIGHLGLLYDARAFQAIADELPEPSAHQTSAAAT